MLCARAHYNQTQDKRDHIYLEMNIHYVVAGGCGSMYDIQIEAKEFKGKRTVMQHRMINEVTITSYTVKSAWKGHSKWENSLEISPNVALSLVHTVAGT